VVVLLAAVLVWRRRPSGRKFGDWCRLNLPLLRSLYGHMYVSRTARTMSTLLGAGVNVLDVIDICRGVTGNVYWDRLWDAMERGVREGRQLSEIVVQHPLIPANVASMIGAGERSGRLPEVMERVAEFEEEELDTSVGAVTTFIEPMMIVVMGALIGGIAIALLLPILTQHRYLMGG
jgi:type IV pilus assembly protein PilC